MIHDGIIAALASGGHGGAIAMIRISGRGTIEKLNPLFDKDITKVKSNSTYVYTLKWKQEILDEVLATIYRAPKSYTGEDMVEISCHASGYIIKRILSVFAQMGIQAAMPGAFTLRAFLNKKKDLSQAEAVADLIDADSKASHNLAWQQMKGGYSEKIDMLSAKLLELLSLLELELDFGDQDVDFADKKKLKQLAQEVVTYIDTLTASHKSGKVMKEGIPMVIAGKPNVGKSSLLNWFLQDDRAIVSDIPGTTRDSIEEKWEMEGIKYRLIDTAGIRETKDPIESLGVKRTKKHIAKAAIILYMVASNASEDEIHSLNKALEKAYKDKYLLIINKIDLVDKPIFPSFALSLSVKKKIGLKALEKAIINKTGKYIGQPTAITISNSRHYYELLKASDELKHLCTKIDESASQEFLASHLKNAITHLGSITGKITSDDVLENIFKNFCIGK